MLGTYIFVLQTIIYSIGFLLFMIIAACIIAWISGTIRGRRNK
jgi:hypothetical protein